MVALNCARNAIVYAVCDAQYSRLWIPFYMCGSVKQTLERYHIPNAVYHMNEKLEPVDVCMDSGDGILYPHFFGVFTKEKIDAVIQRYQRVILDNTQAFLRSRMIGFTMSIPAGSFLAFRMVHMWLRRG